MRHHMRAWIAQWDMLRLEGRHTETDVVAVVNRYEEDDALSEAPPEAPDGEE